jgi:hypothetical protein
LLNWKNWNAHIRTLCATTRKALDLAKESQHE